MMTKNEAKQILIEAANAKIGNTPLLPHEIREAIDVVTSKNVPKTIDDVIRQYLAGVVFDPRISETECGALKEHISKAIKFGAQWQSMQ